MVFILGTIKVNHFTRTWMMTEVKMDLFNGLARAYLKQGKDGISEKYALEAYEISTRIQFMEGKQECALILYNINKNKEKFKKALTYHEIYQNISDTLHRNENKRSPHLT